MLALEIREINSFMSRLLRTGLFDSFLLEEAVISTYNTFTIEGRLNEAFYTKEEWEDRQVRVYDYSTWESMRPVVFSLIRGKKTPTDFRILLRLMPQYLPNVLKPEEVTVPLSQINALLLTCKYDGSRLMLITGTSYQTFVPDKSADQLWDRTMKIFLDRKGVAYEEL